ncbi:unnamed protein product [Symbiodinium sp. CCMP2592]|nr:unnamed protein product [Symbiodinium sp. CCMP2592]
MHPRLQAISCLVVPLGAVTIHVPSRTGQRWRQMCREEQVQEGQMLSGLIRARQELLDEVASEVVDKVPSRPDTLQPSERIPESCRFDADALDGALEIFGFAGNEIECPDLFMKAVVTYARHLIAQRSLHEYDIMHEVIRAETAA